MRRPPRTAASSVREAYDSLSETYDELYADAESRAEDQWLGARLARQLRPGDRVLDVGCGTGWLLDIVPGLDPANYVGLDLSEGMLARAREKHPAARFHAGSMTRPWLPQVGEGYDLVISTYCSASYASPWTFASQTASVLRAGGRVLAMPHAEGNARRPAHLPDEAYTPAPALGEYYAPWEADAARDAFASCGFRGVTARGMRHPRVAPPAWAPLAVHRLWLHGEQRSVGRTRPDAMTFLLIEGHLPERKH